MKSKLMAGLIACLLAVALATPAEAKHRNHHHYIDANGSIIGSRPAGCPHAYCGCGLRKYLGINDVRLNLAWNWARLFRHTYAHPGAAAVRAHHVMLLESHVGGSRWLVRDFNGGRHLTWLHERNVNGYVFVEPSGSRAYSDLPHHGVPPRGGIGAVS